MKKVLFLLLSTILITSTAWAGGSIFGHKKKSSNAYGVYSVNVHVCSSLECPPVRIVSGSCDGEHMEKSYGVCICEKGYVANGSTCELCPDGQFSDGISGCTECPAGTYKASADATSCTECPPAPNCGNNTCCELSGEPDVCGRNKPSNKGNGASCLTDDEQTGTCMDGTCLTESQQCQLNCEAPNQCLPNGEV